MGCMGGTAVQTGCVSDQLDKMGTMAACLSTVSLFADGGIISVGC